MVTEQTAQTLDFTGQSFIYTSNCYTQKKIETQEMKKYFNLTSSSFGIKNIEFVGVYVSPCP